MTTRSTVSVHAVQFPWSIVIYLRYLEIRVRIFHTSKIPKQTFEKIEQSSQTIENIEVIYSLKVTPFENILFFESISPAESPVLWTSVLFGPYLCSGEIHELTLFIA